MTKTYEDKRGEAGPNAPAEAEHDIDGIDGYGDEGDEADDGCRDDVDYILVDGTYLGDQLKQASKSVPGGAQQAGVRHNDVDGNGDTRNGRNNTLSRNFKM